LYAFTTNGQKVEWMRSNPKVCVQFDEIQATNDWQSVVVIGRFEELTSDPQHAEARNTAHQLLSKTAEWWQPAFVKTVLRGEERPLEPVYFRIEVLEVSGHKAVKAG
ncbi:MAG: pyridoxamine 5'-phosphate oxidase family protein, partial [Alphaproteobacteria bacterium]